MFSDGLPVLCDDSDSLRRKPLYLTPPGMARCCNSSGYKREANIFAMSYAECLASPRGLEPLLLG